MSPSQGQMGNCRHILRECESARGMGNEESYLGGGAACAGRHPVRRVRALKWAFGVGGAGHGYDSL